MANTIYDNVRTLIGDSTAPYTLGDGLLLMYMDKALDKASEILVRTMDEDITITTADITAGYKDLTYEIRSIIDTDLGYEWQGTTWECAGAKRIRFIDTSAITAGTYNFKYNARWTKNDGTKKTDVELDIPSEHYLAIIYLTIWFAMQETGILQVDGTMDFIRSKSEEGMSVSYGGTGEMAEIGSPTQLYNSAIAMLRNSPMGANIMTSIQI